MFVLNVAHGEDASQRGYRFLTTKSYLPADFDQQTFDELWQTWEEPARSQARDASPEERRRLTFSRYGLTEKPGDPHGVALQYVAMPDKRGDSAKLGWAMNCLACHGGKVAGRAIDGLPNSLYGLQSLTEDVTKTKVRLGKELGHMDRGSILLPLGGTFGTTNAVMFGKLLLAYRDPDLNLIANRLPPTLVHHDMDAPPWWNVKRKQRLYIDGFAPKSPRALMQFLLIPRNDLKRFEAWEADYVDLMAWIESLEAPKWPWTIDKSLAETGRVAFNRVCAECHGTYGEGGSYPERHVPIDEIGTDRVRFDSLDPPARKRLAESWFTRDAKVETILDPVGYVAPPLDGVWASAPYLHNGSVPTLWHLLHPDERPVVWRRTEDGYDQQRVGLEVTTFDEVPNDAKSVDARRRVFDTRKSGKSAAGHRYPDKLSEEEKRAVLEYLKTL
jgi:mono/diheme cytochrome c family protein